MAAIDCKRLAKTFKTKGLRGINTVRAIHDLSLTVEQGHTIGLVGANGAGKSTLMSLIAGLIFPSQGSVCVNGFPARSLRARRSTYGKV